MLGQAFFDSLLIFTLTILHPPTGNLTFSFVHDEGPIPNADQSGQLVAAVRYGCGLRPDYRSHQGDLNWLLAPAVAWPESWVRQLRGKTYLVELFVDLNRLPPDRVVAAVKHFRTGPYRSVKAHVVFRFARCFTQFRTAEGELVTIPSRTPEVTSDNE